MDALGTAEPRGGKGGANFSRMVAVIIDDGDAALSSAPLVTPLDAVEKGQTFANHIGRDT